MKNYEQMAQNVMSKYADAKAAEEHKRKTIGKCAVGLGSLALVALVSITVWQLGPNGKEDIVSDSVNIGEKDYISPSSEYDGTGQAAKGEFDGDITGALGDPTDEPARIIFTINNITGESGAARLNFSEDKYYSKTLDLSDLAEYFGEDFSNLKKVMPKDYEYSGAESRKFYYEIENDNIAYDTAVFSYTKNEQAIRIMVSKKGAPFDCAYRLGEEKMSDINGVQVLMGGTYREQSEIFEFVFADFEKDGINYRITLDNPEGEDAITLLYKLLYILTE